ncbi:MAG TPA: hypothetical protein DCZ95_19430 [Verrucomicrobia bacterium]|nr:MAG: hypothetical protein A2X46_12860 [Lentisphaerae bacterium GWF2_57_35]HBA86260.1 hypothetical protein [Verrucomicrobiota bacterium]
MNEQPQRGPLTPAAGPSSLPMGKAWIRYGLMAFCALAALALIRDIGALQHRILQPKKLAVMSPSAGERQDLILGLSQPPFKDPSGLFSIVPPKGWRRDLQPKGTSYNVVFLGPYKMDISIQVLPVEDDRFGELLKRIWKIEKQFDADMHVETVEFVGRPAVRRTVRLYSQKVLILDFVEDGVSHHLQYSAPPELFDEYLPAVMPVLETYRPTKEADRHYGQ